MKFFSLTLGMIALTGAYNPEVYHPPNERKRALDHRK